MRDCIAFLLDIIIDLAPHDKIVRQRGKDTEKPTNLLKKQLKIFSGKPDGYGENRSIILKPRVIKRIQNRDDYVITRLVRDCIAFLIDIIIIDLAPHDKIVRQLGLQIGASEGESRRIGFCFTY